MRWYDGEKMRWYHMLRGEVHKKYLRQIVGYYKRTNTKSRLTKIYYVGLKQKQGKQKLTLVRVR